MSARVRFEGGTADGTVREVSIARYCIVPRTFKTTATGEEFRRINLDEVWNGRVEKYIRQYYRLEKRGDELVYVYEREEQPT